MTSNASNASTSSPVRDAVRGGVRDLSAVWWWFLALGVAWTLVGALAGPKLGYWWTQLVLGAAELALGVWAVRSWQRSLLTLVTLVGVWAIVQGVGEIFAAFSAREGGRRAERLVG